MNFQLQDLLGIAPILLAVVAALAVITLDIFLSRADDREIMPMTTAGALFGIGLLLVVLWDRKFSIFGDQLIVDRFGLAGAAICAFAAMITVLISPRYLQRCSMEHGEYYGLVLFALTGMMLMCMSNDLMMVFLAIETMSLAIYGLVGMNKSDALGAEAATKYFVMGAIGSGFFTFGIALVYAASGTTSIPGVVENILFYWKDGSQYLALSGLAMMIAGFCFKIGAVPFHTWVPDVYQGAPTPVTGFMASGVKVAAGIVLARVLLRGFDLPDLRVVWSDLLAGVALVSMLLGGFVGLQQTNIEQLLGYSAIAHTGFMLMVFLSDPTKLTSPMSLIVYLTSYALSAVGAFAVLSQLRDGAQDVTDLTHVQGLARKRPWLAASMALFVLSMAGVPGTAGFIGKLMVFIEALSGGYTYITVVAILVSLISLGYYLPIIVSMYMREPTQEFSEDASGWGASAAIAACALGTLILGVAPQPLIDAAWGAARQLLGLLG